MNKKSNLLIQYLAALSVSLSNLSIGSSGAWPSPIIPKLLGNETYLVVNEDEVGWIVAMSAPGVVAGNLISSSICDKLGRRNTLLLSALPNIIGTLVIVFGNRAWYLFVARFLWGVAIGVANPSNAMYIGEIANKEIRGILTLFTRIMFNLGHLLLMTIGPFVTFEVLNYMMLVLPICYFLACLWIPESPYYLIKEGKIDAARKALKKLKNIDNEVLEKELEATQSHVNNEMKHDTSVKELFTGKRYRRALVVGIGVKLALIMSGNLILSQYIGLIMQESGANMSLTTVLIVHGAVRFVVSLLSAIVVDKVNRRTLYIFTYLGTFLSYVAASIYFSLKEVINMDLESLRTFGFVPFLCLLAINVLSSIGYNVVTFITLAEIFPMNIKAVALTTVNISSGLLNFATTLGFSFVKQHFGVYCCFIIFGLSCLCATIFVYFFLPETRGKSLKDIQIILQGKYFDEE